MFRKRLVVLAVALVSTMALLAGCAGSGSKAGTVTIGSKDFTESIVLGELLAQLIEGNTDLKVERKLNLGGTKVNFDGIKAGQLDMYVDYDGTAWGAHLGNTDPVTDPTTLFDVVNKDLSEQFKIRFTEPFGFNNTYALAMPRAIAEEHNIKTYTDLAAHADKFVFGTTSEFMGREVDGFNPMSDTYGFTFKDVKSMTAGLRYKAVEQGEIQVMDAYATDGNLKAFDMVILEDDKKFFPPYYGAPLVRIATLEKYPELEPLLNKLGNTMNDEIMQELNYRVAVEEETVEAVASDWLKSMNLIN
jgi:osmoprotectant transport system substrate-binding protein